MPCNGPFVCVESVEFLAKIVNVGGNHAADGNSAGDGPAAGLLFGGGIGVSAVVGLFSKVLRGVFQVVGLLLGGVGFFLANLQCKCNT